MFERDEARGGGRGSVEALGLGEGRRDVIVATSRWGVRKL